MKTTTTTTIAEKKEKVKLYYLNEFLDTLVISTPQRRVYEKKLASKTTQHNSIVDWNKELKKIQK